jgi:hypothetical protein
MQQAPVQALQLEQLVETVEITLVEAAVEARLLQT